MPIAIILITIGGLMAYAGLKGVSIADAFQGAVGNPLDPAGAKGGNLGAAIGTQLGLPGDEALPLSPDPPDGGPLTVTRHGIKGPNAAKLEALTNIAEQRFHLRVSQVCRSRSATYGSPTSFHKSCRAVDMTGSVPNKVAFARFAKSQLAGIAGAEVFCDQAGMVAPGYEHTSHVHIGA